ncbi:MAG: hypothetical protein OP8BY_0577 [Candidatus Saccharicenans subterraneus]|uniref:Uncharacterized protein n=1 Tax=Candidatus Saccharicenans subterraneus TaxID=2508984 RepID=A0A3E2BK47_9BACT|nr:MAG: hypothetical protein OP8BY_0577 [Candidatus Saccharicenans subterraneum]
MKIKEEKMLKKPYVRKLDQIEDISVWIVDGNYVRKNLDEEFTNFGQHYRFRFIPRHEFWIDQEHGAGEQQFFIDHLLVEYRLMASGVTYDKALAEADAVEQKERRKAELIRRIEALNKQGIIDEIHKTLIKKYSGRVKVWIVRGELVRSLFFIDFTEGGHDKIYHFIPENEVWLDDDLSRQEMKFVLLHELHERHLMDQGWPYYKAHRSASKIEYHCRHHPEQLEEALLVEKRKNG